MTAAGLLYSDAEFSPCRTWRYSLIRIWDFRWPVLNVIGLNPSTADETTDDPTIRRCIAYARRWGRGGLVMTNIFAYRSTDPRGLLTVADPVGPGNDAALYAHAARSYQVLAAWGAHGAHQDRSAAVRALLAPVCVLECLGRTKDGEPRHPLYMRADLTPEPLDLND